MQNEKSQLLKNPHFWTILFISLVFTVIYSSWPWAQSVPKGIGNFIPMDFLGNYGILEFRYRIVCSLFLIPILYSSIIFSWRGAIAVWIPAFGIIIYKTLSFPFKFEFILIGSLVLFLPALITIIFAVETGWKNKQRRILELHNDERERMRKESILNIIEAQENERKYIAHNLHDDIIQNLLTIINRTQSFLFDHIDNEDKKYLEWINSINRDTVNELRRLCAHLRPSVLDRMGLIPALRALIDRMNTESNIKFNFYITGIEQRLPFNVEVNIFRAIQEALINIRKHSKATAAIIEINFTPDSIEFTVEDNGQGFDTSNIYDVSIYSNKLGLSGMRWRIESLGGVFQINSIVGKKTTIKAKINYDKSTLYTESKTDYRI